MDTPDWLQKLLCGDYVLCLWCPSVFLWAFFVQITLSFKFKFTNRWSTILHWSVWSLDWTNTFSKTEFGFSAWICERVVRELKTKSPQDQQAGAHWWLMMHKIPRDCENSQKSLRDWKPPWRLQYLEYANVSLENEPRLDSWATS